MDFHPLPLRRHSGVKADTLPNDLMGTTGIFHFGVRSSTASDGPGVGAIFRRCLHFGDPFAEAPDQLILIERLRSQSFALALTLRDVERHGVSGGPEFDSRLFAVGSDHISVACLAGAHDLAMVECSGPTAGSIPINAVRGGECLVVPAAVDCLPPAFMGMTLIPEAGVRKVHVIVTAVSIGLNITGIASGALGVSILALVEDVSGRAGMRIDESMA